MDLLLSEATVTIVLDKNSLDNNGILWKVSDEGFLFEFKIQNRLFLLTRNDYTCVNPFNQIENDRHILIFVIWSFTTLGVSYSQEGIEKLIDVRIPTTPSSPPVSIVNWARQKGLISRQKYDSEQVFRQVVISCLQTIQEKIDESGGYTQFWDIEYGKNGSIKSRNPKKETEIHPTIKCLLSDQSLLLSFEVIPEYKTGVGNLDFLIIGTLVNGGFTKVCVEFKNAHSKDIFHGLTTQLPKYMKNTRAIFGIYAILNYHGEWFQNPKNIGATKSDLFVKLTNHKLLAKDPIQENIREIYFSLSKPKSASTS